jgi:putative acyl-CoA dehydrogenase
MAGFSRFETHEVVNQSPPYVNVDLFASDPPLQEAVRANGVGDQAAALSAFGKLWGTADMVDAGRIANENPPKLKTYDERGFHRDTVEFHPAYHRFMAESIGAGLHAMTWREGGERAPAPAEVARAARYYMVAQIENGHMCPVTMTRAAVAALAAQPDLRDQVLPKIISRQYDPKFCPWSDKAGMTLGMGMTEKQGGTDVRANTTRAEATTDGYLITGHKWFMSAPMCDAFLVLAQATRGLSCFLMPRFRPDGSVNGLHFQRLKDKLGNRSNASAEVEFADAFAWRVGEEGRGVRTIIEMVQLTRIDCAIASAGLMRMALAQALHHARHRTVFQRRLADQPMMQAVLADLALECEGALALVMRVCRALDLARTDSLEALRARVLTPAAKYWICKIAPTFVYEAMECLGGNGYIEESMLARLYREAPVNAIWEGSGNVVCLDVLRAIAQEPDGVRALLERLRQETSDLAGINDTLDLVAGGFSDRAVEAHARGLVERLALLATAAALNETTPRTADLFAQTRLSQRRSVTYGAVDIAPASREWLMQRALPA